MPESHQDAAVSIQIIVFIKRAVSNAGIAITGSGRPPHPPGHVTQCAGAGANGSDDQLHWSRWD